MERRGKCFYCRIDALDAKYGPSMQAELVRQTFKDGKYRPAPPTKRELRKIWK